MTTASEPTRDTDAPSAHGRGGAEKGATRRIWSIEVRGMVAVSAGILVFYIWTVLSSGANVLPNAGSHEIVMGREPAPSYYNLMSNAFLAGQLALLVEPDKRLMEVKDPYTDIAECRSYCLWDCSLYHGKWYPYWGPIPALTLYIPFRALHVGWLPDSFATLIFSYGGFLWSVAILLMAVRQYRSATPVWMQWAGICAVGLSNMAPYLLRDHRVYEVAISGAFFYLMGGMYFLFRAEHAKRKKTCYLLASLFFGLATGCRPTQGIAALLLLAVWCSVLHRSRWQISACIKSGISLAAPFVLCLFVLAIYNKLRFDSWTEMGIKYQLPGGQTAAKFMLQCRYLPQVMYRYFVAPCPITSAFPLFHPADTLQNPGCAPWEPYAGILMTVPIVWLIFMLPITGILKRVEKLNMTKWAFSLAALGVAIVTVLAVVNPATALRYHLDFLPCLLLAAVLIWFDLDTLIRQRWLKIVMRYFVATLIVYGCISTVCMSLETVVSRNHRLRYTNPLDWTSCDGVGELAADGTSPSRAVRGPHLPLRAIGRQCSPA